MATPDAPPPSTIRHLSGLLQKTFAKSSDKIQDSLKDSLTKGKDGLVKSKHKLEHTLGLGQQPSVIPPGTPDIKGEPRVVEIGWHPVGGGAGKWFAEGPLGRMIKERTGSGPDPTQHWAVIVGGFVHQLWMDESLNVIYINEEFDRSGWHTYEVGHTRFNDVALRERCRVLEAAEMTIFEMREKRAAYNLISNNCQNFAVKLLDVVQLGQHITFATSFAVYRAAVGPGTIEDVLKTQAAELPPPEQEANMERPPGHVIEHAQQVMDQETTQLDDHTPVV